MPPLTGAVMDSCAELAAGTTVTPEGGMQVGGRNVYVLPGTSPVAEAIELLAVLLETVDVVAPGVTLMKSVDTEPVMPIDADGVAPLGASIAPYTIEIKFVVSSRRTWKVRLVEPELYRHFTPDHSITNVRFGAVPSSWYLIAAVALSSHNGCTPLRPLELESELVV